MFSQPMKSNTQNILEIMYKRTTLTNDQQRLYARLDFGYKGEVYFFNEVQAQLQKKPLPLYNLHMNINGSHCQVDCLLIFQHELILFEVKNYQGDYFIDNDKWYTLTRKNIRNPLHQLQRTELLLSQLLNDRKIPIKVRSYLVFTHPQFFLYQAPLQTPVIFPNQISRFIHQLQNNPCSIQQYHKDLSALLISKHQTNPSLEVLPEYDSKLLKKGITCNTLNCNGWMIECEHNKMQCSTCETTEDIRNAVIRSIRDYHTLFPSEMIQMKELIEWMDHCVSIYKVRKVLEELATLVPQGRTSYYHFKERIWNQDLF